MSVSTLNSSPVTANCLVLPTVSNYPHQRPRLVRLVRHTTTPTYIHSLEYPLAPRSPWPLTRPSPSPSRASVLPSMSPPPSAAGPRLRWTWPTTRPPRATPSSQRHFPMWTRGATSTRSVLVKTTGSWTSQSKRVWLKAGSLGCPADTQQLPTTKAFATMLSMSSPLLLSLPRAQRQTVHLRKQPHQAIRLQHPLMRLP